MSDIRQTKEMLKGLLMEVVGDDTTVDAIDYSLTPKPGVVASGLFVSLYRDPGDAPNTLPGAGVYRFQITEDNAVEYRPFVAEQDIEFSEYLSGDYNYEGVHPEYQEAIDEAVAEMRFRLEQTEREMQRREQLSHSRSVSELISRRTTEGKIPKSLQGSIAVDFSEQYETFSLSDFLNSLDGEQLAFFSEWSSRLPAIDTVHPELFGSELTAIDYSEGGRDPLEAAYSDIERTYNNSWNQDEDY